MPSVERLAVDGHAERRARFVLAAVASADRALLVVEARQPGRLALAVDLVGQLGHAFLLDQREDGHLDRRQPRVELHHHARLHLALLVGGLVLGVGLAEERQHRAVHAARRLDDERQVPLLRLVVEVRHVLAAELLVLRQVEVRPVGHALQLGDAEREARTRCPRTRGRSGPARPSRGCAGGACSLRRPRFTYHW